MLQPHRLLPCAFTHLIQSSFPFLNVSYPSPSRYTCVSLHTGRTRPMVHRSLQSGREDTEKQDQEGNSSKLNQNLNGNLILCALCDTVHHHLGYTHLSELGKSMPSRMLSCLLQRVETTIRYLTLTELTDSNCTACATECREREQQGDKRMCETERRQKEGQEEWGQVKWMYFIWNMLHFPLKSEVTR